MTSGLEQGGRSSNNLIRTFKHLGLECLIVGYLSGRINITDEEGVTLENRPGTEQDAITLVNDLRRQRIPTRLKTTKLVGCPICEYYHPASFNGDCREDGQRFHTPYDSDDIAYHFDNGDPGTDQLEYDKIKRP